MIKERILKFENLKAFDFTVRYLELIPDSYEIKNDNSHIHEECEIYINLSGDVSFMVEDRIYPVSPGSIIITRPYEYHHCIYHSDAVHKHFWILFSAKENEHFLDLFFNRSSGTDNLIIIQNENLAELKNICNSLISDCENSKTADYLNFFKLIFIMESAKSKKHTIETKTLPTDITLAINYINKNISYPISVNELAKISHVSVNTLERHFAEYLKSTPSVYIKNRRLAQAVLLLNDGKNITETALECGFSDSSHFIAEFKKYFNTTPFKFKKSNMS